MVHFTVEIVDMFVGGVVVDSDFSVWEVVMIGFFGIIGFYEILIVEQV